MKVQPIVGRVRFEKYLSNGQVNTYEGDVVDYSIDEEMSAPGLGRWDRGQLQFYTRALKVFMTNTPTLLREDEL